MLVARFAGRASLASSVEAAVRAQQNNDEAVETAVAFARLLEKVLLVSFERVVLRFCGCGIACSVWHSVLGNAVQSRVCVLQSKQSTSWVHNNEYT